MLWLGKNYSVTHNPGVGGMNVLYYLYGLERVGRLTAKRFIPSAFHPTRPTQAGPIGIAKAPSIWFAAQDSCRASGRAPGSGSPIP